MNYIYKVDKPTSHTIIILLGVVTGLLLHYYVVNSPETKGSVFGLLDLFCSIVLGILSSYLYSFLLGKLKSIYERYDLKNLILNVLKYTLPLFLVLSVFLYIYLTTITKDTDAFLLLFVKCVILLLIISLLALLVHYAIISYNIHSHFSVLEMKNERRQTDLQLRALKSQLAPHFLFNNLNTISSLIHTNSSFAEMYIRNLTIIYKHIIDGQHNELKSLKDELSLARAFLDLAKVRYGEFFEYSINVADTHLAYKLPALALQIVIENTLKHNVIDTKNKLWVEVFTQENHVVIRNNITSISKNPESFNIGLDNIKQRYHLMARKVIIVDVGENYTVQLPLIV